MDDCERMLPVLELLQRQLDGTLPVPSSGCPAEGVLVRGLLAFVAHGVKTRSLRETRGRE